MQQAVAALPAGGQNAAERLLALLADVDSGHDGPRSRTALDTLTSAPAALVAVDHYARRSWEAKITLEVVATRLDHAAPGLITMALASLHSDGRVRERAVRAILHQSDPVLAPFLVLRAGDWVQQVRDLASLGVAMLLAQDPANYLPAMLPVALRTDARDRGRFVMNQLVAAILAAPEKVRAALSSAGATAQRRLIFDLDRTQGRLTLAGLVGVAEEDPDPRLRAQAAEAACREAVWTEQAAVLRRLAGGRRADVRVTALVGLLRLGLDADVVAHLDDPSALVRAVARQAARKAGENAVARYRAVLSGPTPTPGAVAGFVETVPGEAAVLFPLLEHADRTVRAQAVRAVARLGAVTPDRITPLLRDPAAAVVREAATALRPCADRLPPGLPWELLEDGRPEVRRAGYRLLNGNVQPLIRLRAAVLLTLDPDPALARRGRADTVHLIRRADCPRPSDGDLRDLAHRAADRLDERAGDLLRQWLGG
ncbi:hypothetical protein GCM10010532_040180 [Dactylosporangium siamense]|uniref:HEAT repeat domain-containing protein n=1 Tax=Dactylosporangium siamense TaxID=685454 RepID=A0A919UB73_9ACTN|nr:hypothetical protein Dsi01nite_072500 [Dactylosporangium siamense]